MGLGIARTKGLAVAESSGSGHLVLRIRYTSGYRVSPAFLLWFNHLVGHSKDHDALPNSSTVGLLPAELSKRGSRRHVIRRKCGDLLPQFGRINRVRSLGLTKDVAFAKALVGKRVSHAWRGHGSAIFLEFGSLSPTRKLSGRAGQRNGELGLMIEWSWRIENRKEILGGSWSDERKWKRLLQLLVGRRVTSVDLFGSLPEIVVSLTTGLKVTSFMTADGQPSWALIGRYPPLGTLCVEDGKLHVGRNDS